MENGFHSAAKFPTFTQQTRASIRTVHNTSVFKSTIIIQQYYRIWSCAIFRYNYNNNVKNNNNYKIRRS